MPFIDVLLRGVGWAGQALALGGVALIVCVLRGWRDDEKHRPLVRRSLSLTALGAVVVALAQALGVLLEIVVLADGGAWPLRDALATRYVQAAAARVLGGAALAGTALALTRGPRRRAWAGLVVSGGVIAGAAAGTSHAMAELHGRSPLVILTAVHQLAAAVWIGGLVHIVAAAFKRERPSSVGVLRRFSNLAAVSVVTLVATGFGLSAVYVGSAGALVGTSYGLMVLTKAVILVGLLVLGALNNRAVRRLREGRAALQPRLRQFLEVEIGLGVTVLFVAASLTSSPPARDVVADRASVAEVATIFTPQWPRLTSPTHAELAGATALGDPSSPRTDEDTAWSEYNHHIAGVFVLAIGLLALVASTSRGRWARHWPLLLLGLAAFLFVRDDPEVWPLGPLGFWASLGDVEVLQHRVFVLLVVALGIFEWMVRTQRLKSPRWAMAFPMLCAVGGALLLTHSHVLSNVKAAYLMEITHTPLALLGLVAGWGRWLELRLPDRGEGVPERVWATALALVGVLLLLYREG